jgi:DnaJ-class molecular chaperone
MEVRDKSLEIKLRIVTLVGLASRSQGEANACNNELRELYKILCPTCNGSGFVNSVNCLDCNGTGRLSGELFNRIY